ncbi:MAG: hypothetical protein GY772_14150 [bacterium]|nr:hypothetical protein [bacterium]
MLDEAQQSSVLANSEQDFRPGQTQDMFMEAASKVGGVRASRKREGQELSETVSLLLKKAARSSADTKHGADDSDDGCDWLQHVPCPGGLELSSQHGAEKTKAKAKVAKASSATAARVTTGNLEGGGGGINTVGKVSASLKKSVTRQTREINAADLVSQEAQQIIDMAKSSKSFRAVTEQSLAACLRKLDGRLKPELVKVYTAQTQTLPEDEDEDEHDSADGGSLPLSARGLKALTELKDQRGKIAALLDLLRSLSSASVSASSGRADQGIIALAALRAHGEAMEKAGVVLCSYPLELILMVSAQSAVARKSFAEFADVLDLPRTQWARLGGDGEGDEGEDDTADGTDAVAEASRPWYDEPLPRLRAMSSAFPPAVAPKYQRKLLQNALHSVLTRSDDTAFADAHGLVEAVARITVASPGIRAEMESLGVLFKTTTSDNRCADAAEVEREVQAALTTLRSSTSALSKALDVFPVLVSLTAKAQGVLASIKVDQNLQTALEKLEGAPPEPPAVLLESGAATVAEAMSHWQEAVSKYAEIVGAASEAFKHQHAERLAAFQARQCTLQKSLLLQHCHALWSAVAEVLASLPGVPEAQTELPAQLLTPETATGRAMQALEHELQTYGEDWTLSMSTLFGAAAWAKKKARIRCTVQCITEIITGIRETFGQSLEGARPCSEAFAQMCVWATRIAGAHVLDVPTPLLATAGTVPAEQEDWKELLFEDAEALLNAASFQASFHRLKSGICTLLRELGRRASWWVTNIVGKYNPVVERLSQVSGSAADGKWTAWTPNDVAAIDFSALSDDRDILQSIRSNCFTAILLYRIEKETQEQTQKEEPEAVLQPTPAHKQQLELQCAVCLLAAVADQVASLNEEEMQRSGSRDLQHKAATVEALWDAMRALANSDPDFGEDGRALLASLQDVANAIMVRIVQRVTELYAVSVDKLAAAAAPDTLQIEKAVDAKCPAEEIFAMSKNKEAKQLKKKWDKHADEMAQCRVTLAHLNSSGCSPQTAQLLDEMWDNAENASTSKIDGVKLVIGGLMVGYATCKPLADGEARETLLAHGREGLAALRVTLPAKMHMLMQGT